MFKSNKAITLVALVITIIVLLILAGVSISLVVGDNGIMTRAKDAGTKTNEADAVENFKLAVASLTSEFYEKTYSGTAPTEKTVVEYVAANISGELGKLDYEISGTMTGTVPTDKDTDYSVSIHKKNSTNNVTVNYTITTKGNISNIKKQ